MTNSVKYYKVFSQVNPKLVTKMQNAARFFADQRKNGVGFMEHLDFELPADVPEVPDKKPDV